MIRGIDSAAAGMMAQMDAQDSIANNLANVNTAGFKRDIKSFSSVLNGALGTAVPAQMVTGTGIDLSQGAMRNTGDNFNLALEGSGYFTVQTPTGPAYTRDGTFTRSNDGFLVTGNGDKVMGQKGPIQVADSGFKVSETGDVTDNGVKIDSLQIAAFSSQAALQKMGSNLWTTVQQPAAATDTRVHQGCLEASNVSTVTEMVNMLSGYRTYEAGQKSIKAQDETLDKLVNDVGRVG